MYESIKPEHERTIKGYGTIVINCRTRMAQWQRRVGGPDLPRQFTRRSAALETHEGLFEDERGSRRRISISYDELRSNPMSSRADGRGFCRTSYSSIKSKNCKKANSRSSAMA